MLNIILLHSPFQRTGKTVLAEVLVARGIVDARFSFAHLIKQLAFNTTMFIEDLRFNRRRILPNS